MKKPTKIMLGIASLWPILYMTIFFVFTFSQVFLFSQEGPMSPSSPPTWFLVIFGLHFLTMLWIFVLLIIYIVNVFRNNRVAKEKKALWAVVLFLGNVVAMPVYWYLYIWREPKKTIEGITSNTP
ncbi:MAG: hypothetical protein HY776_00890 [Actinobacteria bacterium]|nr:hypothetical protein [Actinomycetota bacterium]